MVFVDASGKLGNQNPLRDSDEPETGMTLWGTLMAK